MGGRLALFAGVLSVFCLSALASEIAPAFLWRSSIVATNFDDRAAGASIALDRADNSYVSGFFYGMADFGPTNLTNSAGTESFPSQANLFAAKYDDAGSFLWVRQIAGGGLGFFGSVVFEYHAEQRRV